MFLFMCKMNDVFVLRFIKCMFLLCLIDKFSNKYIYEIFNVYLIIVVYFLKWW